MAYKFERLEVWQLAVEYADRFSEKLFAKLQAFRTSLKTDHNLREESNSYEYDDTPL
jgi:hypothetical protein